MKNFLTTNHVWSVIPARSGSKRIPNKNIKTLAEHPLIAYTTSAIKSNIFKSVIVSTDSDLIATISSYYGAEVPFLRPSEYAADTSPDFEWLDFTMKKLDKIYDNLAVFYDNEDDKLCIKEQIKADKERGQEELQAIKEFNAKNGIINFH